jgi:cysteine rich repeat protein
MVGVQLRAAAAFVGALAWSHALAEDPCAADVRQFCPDVKAGSTRISSCLRENQARLSATCRGKLDADALRARKFIQEFGRACRSDMEQYCAGVEPGGGRVFGCLAQHQFELTSSCESEVSRISVARGRVAAVRKACTSDVESLCRGVPPQAGPLLECLQANETRLSSGCNAADLREAMEAGTLVDVMEEMSTRDRVREALQILQGLDSVAFSRSQILLQLDSFEALKKQANASRILFNPQFVFGNRREFSLQLKVPVVTLYPRVAAAPTESGLGAVVTSFAWNFLAQKQVRQYLGLGLQWQTASRPALGAPWALAPSYAVAFGLMRGVSLTAQVVWLRSIGSSSGYPEQNLLQVEPILVFALPGRSFLALDTKLGKDFVSGTFLPLMKGVAGLFVDRQKSLSITAWYQTSLTSAAAAETYDYEVGLSLAYYFDW